LEKDEDKIRFRFSSV